MRIRRILPASAAAILGLSVASASAPSALAQNESGIHMTPNSASYLISKDVGNERWAISFNLGDRTVTGNVFKTDGSPPSFIWCRITGETPAANPADNQYLLDCFGADACAAAPCPDTAWTQIATGLPIGGDFLLPDETKATFGFHVEPIFNTRCAIAGCHAGAEPAQELNLEDGQAYRNIFRVLAHAHEGEEAHFQIEPFDPNVSHLYLKLLGLEEGDRMPQGGPFLTQEQTDAIRDWILEGAAKN